MTAIYIVGGILIFFFILLLIPVGVHFNYRDKLFFAVKYAGIKLFDNSKVKKRKTSKVEKEEVKEDTPASEKKNYITRIFSDKGKIEGIKFIAKLIKSALSRIIWVIKKIKFREFCLSIGVSSDDAAKTAISYGAVCGVVYPVINLIEHNTDFSVKKVNVYTDFDKMSPEISVSVSAKTRLIYAVIAAVSLFFEFLRLKKESDKNGRE
ncbi:MAG: DUF2953 domain-containing protein [Clostridia bacterium]|nr:DUF2953 domain-containing protein [Clostridia bacterium]